ncbi:MAG: ABC transporter ATP-binding protein [Thaumarchaeota archaeon]|nr:ABC transporter ATP-binding protein [Nitrososphaerota archaeon]
MSPNQPVSAPTHPIEAAIGEPYLLVEGLTIDLNTRSGRLRVLEDITLHVDKGEVVGIVGESGSGKSTLGLAIIGLLDSPPSELVRGSVLFEGLDLPKLDQDSLSKVRGTGIGMVFQESIAALNPVYKTESQLGESIKVMSNLGKLTLDDEGRHKLMVRILEDFRIDQPEAVLKKYPHELSGGMRQRVAIAMALVEKPKLLILDEVTTGLDVYVQNRILALLRELNHETGTSMILITHDLAVAAQICDRVYVMYAGRLMEAGRTSDVLETPQNPYTQTLLAAVPSGFKESPPLPVAKGEPPDLRHLPQGCKFNTRCVHVMEVCRQKEPPLIEVSPGRLDACWLSSK